MWELKQIILSSIYVYSKYVFFVSYICDICFGGTTSLGFIVPPYILEKINHLSSWQIGLVNLTSPLGLVLISKITGKLISRIGNIILMTIGLIIMIVAYQLRIITIYIKSDNNKSIVITIWYRRRFSYLLILQQ